MTKDLTSIGDMDPTIKSENELSDRQRGPDYVKLEASLAMSITEHPLATPEDIDVQMDEAPPVSTSEDEDSSVGDSRDENPEDDEDDSAVEVNEDGRSDNGHSDNGHSATSSDCGDSAAANEDLEIPEYRRQYLDLTADQDILLARIAGIRSNGHGDNLGMSDASTEVFMMPASTALPAFPLTSELDVLLSDCREGTVRLGDLRNELLSYRQKRVEIDEMIIETEAKCRQAETNDQAGQVNLDAALIAYGIPLDLYEKYEAFCKSLVPEFGQQGGFGFSSEVPHSGSYVCLDPGFELFKEFAEVPYNNCNFRSEASTISNTLYKVDFWPIGYPKPSGDADSTWGEEYPLLYKLAIKAARGIGSEPAMEMLVNLPDMNGNVSGGWLFEYIPNPDYANSMVEAERWKFHSAHKIDAPVSTDRKRQRIELLL